MEKNVGSIVPGKFANFTILADNPLTVDPMKIKDLAIWRTVQEGRLLPVGGGAAASKAKNVPMQAVPHGDESPAAAGTDQRAYGVALHVIHLAGHAH